MNRDEGLIVIFKPEEKRDLIRTTATGSINAFSDALKIPDWDGTQLRVALLCFSTDTIDYAAIAVRGKHVSTSKYRAEFSEILDLKSIPLQAIKFRMDPDLHQHLKKGFQGTGGRVPPTTWKELIETIKSMRSDIAEEIDRLMSLTRHAGISFTGQAASILMQERDALGISLEIFSGNNKLRNEVLRSWAPRESDVGTVDQSKATGTLLPSNRGRSSFLAGIPKRYIQEESAIKHDLSKWMNASSYLELGISVFHQGDRTLEVIYANQNALERTLGVDLIYFNQVYGSFVLVQYKLMRDERGEPRYRPDDQLIEEVRRMDDFIARHNSSTEITSHEDFRLSADGFMLKLVPDYGLLPASGELIKGMYITREYMKFLIGPNGPKGERGGSVITFENTPRYMSNTEFAQTVNLGWIGCKGVQSSTVSALIQQYLSTGRALLYAHETGKTAEDAAG